jgi:probable HAF family extracellular repeat protein
MRALLRSGLLWPCCLVACSATPLSSPESALNGKVSYQLGAIAAPDGVQAVGVADINNQGQVAGDALGPAGPDAFTWSAQGGFVTLARYPTADYMSARAINEGGVVAGIAEWQDGGTSRPIIWTDPGYAQDLGIYGTAEDINDRGHVVGTRAPDGVAGIGVAYLWDAANGATSLGTLGGSSSVAYAVNAADDVVGTSELADGTSHAFLWSKGTMTDLGALDGVYSEGYSISDSGEVTGIYQTVWDETRVYRWTRSQGMVDVGPKYAEATDGPTSFSTDVNSVGQIVGGVFPPGQRIRAAVRQPKSGVWQELTPDWPYESFALAVNNHGVIVGRIHESLDIDEVPSRAAIWTPVPGGVVVPGSP